jgi:ABC-2 type transport system ATP-binding protein
VDSKDSSIFEAEGIVKRFRKKTVLDGLSLSLERGAVTVLLGVNGAGKSTLLRLALGVLRAEAGRLKVAGFDPIREPNPLRRAVGYVPDVPDAYGWMRIDEFFRFLRPHYPTWDDERARSLVESLRVPRKTRFGNMSRGEGMKAMLAAALAPNPELLLLDEPFSGLDPLAREDVLRGVIAELREGKRTVLCATHELEVAARIADRVAILANGRVAQHGTVDEVLGGSSEAPRRMLEVMAAAVEAVS